MEIHGNIHFLRTRTGATNVAPCSHVKKNQYPAKIHLRVIDVLDRHPRKGPFHSLHFHGGIYRRIFCIALQREKTGNLIYRIEV